MLAPINTDSVTPTSQMYYYADTHTTHTTHPDGLQVLDFPKWVHSKPLTSICIFIDPSS